MDAVDTSIDLLQWPAMVITVAASWLVASGNENRRNLGFWIFLLSNVLWVVWGWSAHAWALVTLQLALALMNIRGAYKTKHAAKAKAESEGESQAGQ